MSADHEMMNHSTKYYRGEVDFISKEGPLRSVESESNVAAVGTEYDLGTVGRLSIPPEGTPIWREWLQGDKHLTRSLGGKALEALN